MKSIDDMSKEERIFLTNPYYGFLRASVSYSRKADKNYLGLSVSFIKKIRIIFVTLERIEKNLQELRDIQFDFDDVEHAKLVVRVDSDIETLIFQLRAFLDITSRLVKYFYRGRIGRFNYFTDMISWFTEHPLIDEEMYTYLKNNIKWFHDFNERRGKISHALSLGIAWDEKEKKDKPFGFVMNSFKKGETIENLEDFIDNITNGFSDYLKFFYEHFTKRMKTVENETEGERYINVSMLFQQ